MSRRRRFLNSPFVSGLLGGAVVAVFGLDRDLRRMGRGSGGDSKTATVDPPAGRPGRRRRRRRQPRQRDIYKRDGSGVAFIEAKQEARQAEPSPFNPFGEAEGGGTATGSGFVIDTEGHLLTNNHVVEGAAEISVKLGSSDTSYTAKVVGTDPVDRRRAAQSRRPADQLHPLALGNSSKVEVGDPVVAIGNPFGLDRTVTSGIVSALQRQIQAPNGFAISARDPDRRGDQPRQLRRPADRRRQAR